MNPFSKSYTTTQAHYWRCDNETPNAVNVQCGAELGADTWYNR